MKKIVLLFGLLVSGLGWAQQGPSLASGAFTRRDMFKVFFTWTSTTLTTSYGIASSIASGNNAFGVLTNGARVDFGAGASDYASSDGTTVTFAGQINISGAGESLIMQNAGTNARIVWAGTGGNFTFKNNATGRTTDTGGFEIFTNSALAIANAFAFNTAPTISSGFGTTPSITASNGSATFIVNVGGGGAASTGVIGLPAVTNSWICECDDLAGAVSVRQTRMSATTSNSCTVASVNTTTGVAVAWPANELLYCTAFGL